MLPLRLVSERRAAAVFRRIKLTAHKLSIEPQVDDGHCVPRQRPSLVARHYGCSSACLNYCQPLEQNLGTGRMPGIAFFLDSRFAMIVSCVVTVAGRPVEALSGRRGLTLRNVGDDDD